MINKKRDCRYISAFISWVFIDSTWPHYWHCHRLPERSFVLNKRQFHICARCTGVAIGICISLLIIPLRHCILFPFLGSALVLGIDGITQYIGLRNSNNILRFITGLCFGITALPALIAIGGI